MQFNIKKFLAEYAKHSALNIGQALQGIRYFYSHPDIDRIAKRRTFKHVFCSFILRFSLILNDLYFSVFPPHWHHTREEIESFHLATLPMWFRYGYCAWRFDDNGQYKKLTGTEDKRWDPRCKL